jgi:hypothetical protein
VHAGVAWPYAYTPIVPAVCTVREATTEMEVQPDRDPTRDPTLIT